MNWATWEENANTRFGFTRRATSSTQPAKTGSR
jgi:hypothetical protein